MDVPRIGYFHCCYIEGKVQTYAPNRAYSSVSPLFVREINQFERNSTIATGVHLIFSAVENGHLKIEKT